MKTGYCQSCEQTTGHKRAIGIGTLLGAACTGGVSLVATPFYPLRCVRCGSVKESAVHSRSIPWVEEKAVKDNPYLGYLLITLFILAILVSATSAIVKVP
mgnify:CR=1 FL=1